MANDTHTIVYYDSADSAHTTALADLVTAGGVDVGTGIVASGNGYHGYGILDASNTYAATGIWDGTTRYEYGILWDNGGTPTYAHHGVAAGGYYTEWGLLAASWNGVGGSRLSTSGIIESDGDGFAYGILDNSNSRLANGILDTSNSYHATGIFAGYDGNAPYGYYDSGLYYGSIGYKSFNGSGEMYYWDGATIQQAPGGILAYDGYHTDGILDYTTLTRYAYGIWDGTAYSSSGIFDGTTAHGPGILGYDSVYRSSGIWDGYFTYGATGILYDDAGNPTYAAEGCLNDTTDTYYPIEALDVLGGGLL